MGHENADYVETPGCAVSECLVCTGWCAEQIEEPEEIEESVPASAEALSTRSERN